MALEENRAPVETWARRIKATGLIPIAVPLLEITRAFGILVGHALLLGEPLLVGTSHQDPVRSAAEWLEDPTWVDELLARLLDE